MTGSFAALALMAVLASGCSDGCANEVATRIEAPGNRRSAVVFERNCGTTTGFSTQISILAARAEPAGAGNVFVADDDHGTAAAASWGGPWAETVWLDADHLLIRYDSRARVFTRNAEVSGVRITYQPVNR
ncbi:MAG: hypothetical protein K0M78_06955 [Brevundimonas sp.]|nr:hypothetical protein [Brevundimonas sp.]